MHTVSLRVTWRSYVKQHVAFQGSSKPERFSDYFPFHRTLSENDSGGHSESQRCRLRWSAASLRLRMAPVVTIAFSGHVWCKSGSPVCVCVYVHVCNQYYLLQYWLILLLNETCFFTAACISNHSSSYIRNLIMVYQYHLINAALNFTVIQDI